MFKHAVYNYSARIYIPAVVKAFRKRGHFQPKKKGPAMIHLTDRSIQ